MSKDNQTPIPQAPQASRRALLMGFAAAATPMAPALATALGEPAPAEVDPIFGVIAEHRAADAGVVTAYAREDRTGDDDEITDAAQERAGDVAYDLFTTAPTTVAGAAALLEYLGTDATAWNREQTIWEWAADGTGEEVREFPTFLSPTRCAASSIGGRHERDHRHLARHAIDGRCYRQSESLKRSDLRCHRRTPRCTMGSVGGVERLR
jgi:hypothetical protein